MNYKDQDLILWFILKEAPPIPELPTNITDEQTFKLILFSITKAKIAEIVKEFNKIALDNSEFSKITKYSTLKKEDLVLLLEKEIPLLYKQQIIKQQSVPLSRDLLTQAVDFLGKEHKLDKLIKMERIPGVQGIKVKFNRKGSIKTALLKKTQQTIHYECDCRIGLMSGFCVHVSACFLSLNRRKIVSFDEFPFKILKKDILANSDRLHEIEARKLYSSEPDILISNNYKIFNENKTVRLEWGGEFAGKKTISNFTPFDTATEWIASKVVGTIIKPIKISDKSGQPWKILKDQIKIIPKILEDEKLVKKMLRKFKNFPDLPQNIEDLKVWISSDLGNIAKLKSEIAENVDVPPFEAYNGNDPYIFVSYAHADRPEVYPILERLHREGFKIWFDHGIPSGLGWADYIATRLMNCKVFLSFISNNAIKSVNTIDEIEFALNENRPYVGIYLRETDLSPGMKMRLRRIQGLQKYDLDEAEFYNKLILSLKTLF